MPFCKMWRNDYCHAQVGWWGCRLRSYEGETNKNWYSFYDPNLEKETALSKQCFSPKYSIFLNDIFVTILSLIVMSWMRGEQYTSLFYYIIIKNTHTCTSQVFIIMPAGVKKIILPFIFLPSLISQPEWQLSRIGEEKERKKYTQEDGTVQVLS